MTDIIKLPLESEPFHKAIAQKAEGILKDMVDGNGLKATQLRLSREETVIYRILCSLTFRLKPEIQKSTVKGQAPQGLVVGSEAEVVGRAEGLAQEMQKGLDVQNEITQGLQKDQGHGFGLKALTIPMPSARKEFSVVNPCAKCHGAAVVPCAVCHSSGSTPCLTCNGYGTYNCPTCFGTGRVYDAHGNYVACSGRCQATGRLPCPHCNGTKNVICSVCHGQGRTSCPECMQSGYSTDIFQVDYKAQCQFEIDWREVPREAQEIVNKLGLRELATENHGEIIWQPFQVRPQDIFIPGAAFLPVARAEFTTEGRIYPALVAGLQGRILEIEPVLDEAVKPGISALMKLSKGPLARQALVDTACKYRLIRQVLAHTSNHSRRAAYQYLTKNYPLMLSDKYARATVRYAHAALQALSAGPRYKGLAIGIALAGLLTAGYYMSHLRTLIFVQMVQRDMGRFIAGIDIAIWLAGAAIAVYMIKFMTAAALKKMLPQAVQINKSGLPSAGMQGLAAMFATALVSLAIAASATAKPEWITPMLNFLR